MIKTKKKTTKNASAEFSRIHHANDKRSIL